MAPGDVHEVTADGVTDLHYLDTGMYDTAAYGAVYLLDAERPALVDTGIGTNHERVLSAMDEVGVAREDLAFIVPTHVHLDHAGGAGVLADACPNAEVVCHEAGARHLVDPGRLWAGTKQAVGEQIQFYTEPTPVPEARMREVSDGDVVDLGDHELVVHHAPGHAPHQAVFEDPANDAVFTADAAGIYVPSLDTVEPTSPPPNFDPEQCLADVDLLERLDPSVLLFAHFGPCEGTDVLAEYRSTLSAWVDDVEAARAELGDDDAVVERLVEAALARDELVDAWGELKVRAETAMNVRGVLQALSSGE
jgi:glyoxylase-like metal-dependent hydrolase (beta-lactamase superfamily II)